MTAASQTTDVMPVVQTAVDLEKDRIRKQRLETWRLTIEQELQALITEAADLRKTINESKTSTKKKYYTKKFKKISEQVVQLLAIQSQLPPREEQAEDAQVESSVAGPTVIEPINTASQPVQVIQA